MSPPVLRESATRPHILARGESHPAVRAFLDDQVGAAEEFISEVHPADSMYRYALDEHFGLRDFALVNYLRAGLGVHRMMEQVLQWRFGVHGQPRVLDFASGYGRTTRFFVLKRPAAALTVSDIDADAVRFQRERFGVGGFVSAPQPEDLAQAERFDAVFATSFFSHMPYKTFKGWLTALWKLVAEGGVLAFSVNDEAVLPAGSQMPPEGFHFEPLSESESLNLEEYGSTWVTEGFIRDVLKQSTSSARYWRAPRGLWHRQDLYVVLRGPGNSRVPDFDLRGEPEGRLENCEVAPGPALALAGWAVGARKGLGTFEPVTIEAHLGGRLLATTTPDSPRHDVSRHLGDPVGGLRAAARGWGLHAPVSPNELHPASQLLVKALTAKGAEEVLHLATLGATIPYLRLATTSAELEQTRVSLEHARIRAQEVAAEQEALLSRIEAMEASRFWKLRNRWFAAKRFLRLTDEL